MSIDLSRRMALAGAGAAIAAWHVTAAAAAPVAQSLMPKSARLLPALADALAKVKRRRGFATVPMILNDAALWDREALELVLAYRGTPKIAFDNNDITTPWLNLMRNALNGQIWGFGHPDCLVVSVTHGTAHLALLDQAMWDKYGLAKLTGGKLASNTLIQDSFTATAAAADDENPTGAFSSAGATVAVLQRRGVVFLACHNSMWELSDRLQKAGVNPDRASVAAMTADMTNHLVPGVVLTPGAVATLPELERAGFGYVK